MTKSPSQSGPLLSGSNRDISEQDRGPAPESAPAVPPRRRYIILDDSEGDSSGVLDLRESQAMAPRSEPEPTPPTPYTDQVGYKGSYRIGNMVARGAESVLYTAIGGPTKFCVKAIRNRLGRTIGPAKTRDGGGKIEVSYLSKVRHLKNEFRVGSQLAEAGDIPVVRIYALRKVRHFGLEIGYDLLMEYLDGSDLGEKQALKTASFHDKVDYLYQTAKALHYMHQRRFIHLDMKPSNIMVCGGRVKLIDFGVSVILGHKPRSVTGTAGYLSPEQLVRDYLDEGTDLFALGVAFSVIFGGKPLRQSQEDLKSKAMRHEAQYHLENMITPMISDVGEAAQVPELADLICRCTVPKRDKRINSAATLVNNLRRVADENAIPLTD